MYMQEHVLIKVDRLNAKLQSDASKCALQLLGCLFSAEELVNGNPSQGRSQDFRNRGAKHEHFAYWKPRPLIKCTLVHFRTLTLCSVRV